MINPQKPVINLIKNCNRFTALENMQYFFCYDSLKIQIGQKKKKTFAGATI